MAVSRCRVGKNARLMGSFRAIVRSDGFVSSGSLGRFGRGDGRSVGWVRFVEPIRSGGVGVADPVRCAKAGGLAALRGPGATRLLRGTNGPNRGSFRGSRRRDWVRFAPKGGKRFGAVEDDGPITVGPIREAEGWRWAWFHRLSKSRRPSTHRQENASREWAFNPFWSRSMRFGLVRSGLEKPGKDMGQGMPSL